MFCYFVSSYLSIKIFQFMYQIRLKYRDYFNLLLKLSVAFKNFYCTIIVDASLYNDIIIILSITQSKHFFSIFLQIFFLIVPVKLILFSLNYNNSSNDISHLFILILLLDRTLFKSYSITDLSIVKLNSCLPSFMKLGFY